MVFFTCNHCGDSVKKPSVEKHYNTKCRNPVFVSCMDCLKDFREDYVGHIKCISEAEKYSGKDYVPKESKNTGLKKQESWLDIVRSILAEEEHVVPPPVRCIFQKLQIYDNVPRKRAKFENFVINSMRLKKFQAEDVWKVLERALEKFRQAAPKAESHTLAEVKKNGEESYTNGQSVDHAEDEAITSAKKEKKKRLKNISDANTAPEVDQDEPVKKKKKKNKEEANEVENQSPLTTKEEETKKFAPEEEITSENAENQEENNTTEIRSNNEDEKTNENAPLFTESGTTTGTNDIPTENSKESNFKNKPRVYEFDWDNVILKILKHKNEISVEKLREKVIKKYQARHQVDEIPSKVQKTFNKKLRKSALLVVENDIVKIKAK